MGKKAYKFWTLGSWTIDGDNSQRGIDRFTYMPEIGIISGAYSYFIGTKTAVRSAHFQQANL